MGKIEINNEIYGTTDSQDLIYNDTTVSNELDNLNRLLDLIPDVVILTQAEYDALGDIVKTDGKVYYITDAGIDGKASNLSYDNTVTQLTATNVQDAIDECFHSVNDGKLKLATSLTQLKDDLMIQADFNTINSNISKVASYKASEGKTDGTAAARKGNATAANVYTGKTFTNSSASNVAGTMANNGAVTATLTPGASATSYKIPAGYHNGSGKVTIATEQAKKSSMSLTINQRCYYDGDSTSHAPINVQGYSYLSRTVTGSSNVKKVELVGFKSDGTEVSLSTSSGDLSNINIANYVYLYQYFRAKEPSNDPYYKCTIKISTSKIS